MHDRAVQTDLLDLTEEANQNCHPVESVRDAFSNEIFDDAALVRINGRRKF
jgi:hypothetical protein